MKNLFHLYDSGSRSLSFPTPTSNSSIFLKIFFCFVIVDTKSASKHRVWWKVDATVHLVGNCVRTARCGLCLLVALLILMWICSFWQQQAWGVGEAGDGKSRCEDVKCKGRSSSAPSRLDGFKKTEKSDTWACMVQEESKRIEKWGDSILLFLGVIKIS